MMNKRGFLLGAASAVAAPQVLAAAAPAPGSLLADGLPVLSGSPGLAAWQPYLGQSFELTDGQRSWPVTLGNADALAQADDPVRTEQFVLGFANPGSERIPPGVHSLRHANGQTLLLHLAGNGAGGPQSLRAEFNLLLQPV
jgi:hypothetical protein